MAIDWTKSMKQTFSFYKVNADTWMDEEKQDYIGTCTITRDADKDVIESASIGGIPIEDECYIRIYLEVEQGIENAKVCLGTFIVQTPGIDHDGKHSSTTMDAYSPLLELNENPMDLGFYVRSGTNVIDAVCAIASNGMRGPVVETVGDSEVVEDYVAETNDTRLTFVKSLAESVGCHIELDNISRVMFAPDTVTEATVPVWEYTDDNSSILYPNISVKRDIYKIPNVVEIFYSNGLYSRVVNDDPNSPISTVNRGREIIYRETEPNITGDVTQEILDDYAVRKLREKSALEYTLTYSHGYCPVRLHDVVLLNYRRAGIINRKAKVKTQVIECKTGCKVNETAVYTDYLWNPKREVKQ